MNQQEIYIKVSDWMEKHEEDLINDIRRIVAIPSISNPEYAVPPFGKECRTALETMLQIGEEHGFYTENYEYYAGSIGCRKKNWDNMIGFWNHLDVVPVGEGWEYPPFTPTRKGKYLIGRGAQDNKGPAVGILYAMQCIRDLGLPMKHDLCLFVGCDEERGMEDIAYYTSHYPVPALSVIADCGFPVCYGEKGILECRIISRRKLSGTILEFVGGNAGNIIPDRARLVLKRDGTDIDKIKKLEDALLVKIEDEKISLTAEGISGHSAFPEGSKNAICVLSEAVMRSGILTGSDLDIVDSVHKATAGNYGEEFGISYEDELSGKLTCAGTVLKTDNGNVSLIFNIRYPITAKADIIMERLKNYWEVRSFEWELIRNSAPNYFNPTHPAVGKLTETFNALTGQNTVPYTMGGGTYARKLPNAFGFGIGNMPERKAEEEIFRLRPGQGAAHGPDEALDCNKLIDAMKIYVMGILSLNDIELKSGDGHKNGD